MASRPLTIVCAVAVAALLVADGAIVAARRGGGNRRQVPAALETVLPELEAFVERERGARFVRPVDVRLASDDDFEEALRRLRRRDRGAGDDRGGDQDIVVRLFRTLGLIEGDLDLAAIEERADRHVLGFYDAGRDRLLVRGVRLTPAVRRVLVHELTHALDDQRFDLDRPEIDRRDDESPLAFQALVEGDATLVESRYFASLPAAARRQADIEAEPRPSGQAVPRVFEALVSFPYLAGESFVASVIGAGGPERLDRAFAAPPTSTEEILHPERFLAGERPRPLTTPPPDRRAVDAGVLGELVLRLVLQSSLDRAAAARAVDGWGGDRYVAWDDQDGRLCVRLDVVADSSGDRSELLDALRHWSEDHPGSTVTDGEALRLTRCA